MTSRNQNKININVKGVGQECPTHTNSLHRSAEALRHPKARAVQPSIKNSRFLDLPSLALRAALDCITTLARRE
jgi:hypothetical protein